jgi:germination protein YpeB
MINFTKRALVRMIAFPAVIIAALMIMVFAGDSGDCERIELQNNYSRAAGELSGGLENMKNTLLKVKYSNCPQLSGELLDGLYNFALNASGERAREESEFPQVPLKNPLMLAGERTVSEEEAREIAIRITGVQTLALIAEEAGRMASYVFSDSGGSVTVAITKAGGHLSYLLGYREVESERISVSQAAQEARRYLERLGVIETGDIIETFHETRGGICRISFASMQGNITLYTDIIKVAVAMDNGEILSVDKRGWLINHVPGGRGLHEPALGAEEARGRVSPLLTVEGAKLCIISNNSEEILCYEFRCYAEDGRQILVYINADTGREERILLLEISADGTVVI